MKIIKTKKKHLAIFRLGEKFYLRFILRSAFVAIEDYFATEAKPFRNNKKHN